ncbi:uncharacterized protein LOC110461300 [Mizuhopecten yessoensis]|uniref:uncharacterized protein LOC110461300 n=1 Tax=Mizuhopecten yessoensis TaxID=6573 RepID=UPI000B457CC4|nr:uncharacterized protein LOC110461300 [Mizuhopecten yessoensis]
MSSLVSCILENNSSSNTSAESGCVDDLWQLLGTLKPADFRNLMENELESDCGDSDTQCTRHRGLFVDMLSRRGDELSQSLIVSLILQSPRPSEEEMQRCLFHLVALEKPSIELMSAVEDICMGENESFTEIESLSNTQRRSCLSLGALVKNMKIHHLSYADKVTAKIEKWLTTEGRALELEESSENDKRKSQYIVTKMTLLHVLGNAGMERSLDHITSFMEPNAGPSEWRRAAVASLKHFTCNKSADSLLRSVLHDDNRQVKQDAYDAFLSHPNKGKLTVPQKDAILSTSYDYPTLLRLRRSVVTYSASLKDGIYFGISLPGINWKKVIGNSAIGAEFGIILRNNLELELKFLSGHFEIDVYNAAFAHLNIKLLNLKYALLDAKMCYMGHIRYDINILKEFGIKDIEDLANIFDKMSATVIDPIVKAVQTFKDVMNFLKDGGIEKLFNTIVHVLTNLPTILRNIALNFLEHIKTVHHYGGVPWIEHLKRVVTKIHTFINDVQEDAMGFYQKTIDAVTITLPYIGKKLVVSLRKIISAITSFLTSPIQSIASLAKGVLDIKLSIGMFMDFKNIMVETLLKTSGRTPFWQSYGEELIDIFQEIESFVSMVTAPAQSKSEEGESTRLSDCFPSVVEQTLWSKEELKQVVFVAVNETFFTSDFGQDIFEKVKDVMDVYKSLKSSYKTLQSYVQNSISLVQRVFGPKFHKEFPTHRRPETSGCGQGVWPTTSSNEFQTTGVDVRLAYGRMLVSPVNGRVYRESSKRILIKPTDAGLSDFEIIIENVEAVDTISDDGRFAEAGETIAMVLKSKCEPNFLHVSVRKISPEGFDSDEDYTYIDPSRFLDRIMPIPRWVLECKDFYFKHIFQTVDIGNFGAYFDDLYKEIKRTVEKTIDKLAQQTVDDVSFEIQFGTDANDGNSFLDIDYSGGSVLDTLKQSLPDFGNVMKLYSFSGITDGLNILKLVDMGSFTLQKIHSMLETDLLMKLDLMINELRIAGVDISQQDPSTLSMSKLQGLFKDLPDDVYGDWQSTVHEALLKYEKDCPNFKGVVGKGTVLACKAQTGCRGLSCAVPLCIGIANQFIKLDITIDPCAALLYITDASVTTTVAMDESEINPEDEIMQMTWRDFLDFLSQIAVLDNDTLKIAGAIRKFVLESLVERSFSEAYTQAISSAFPNVKDTCAVDEQRLPRLNGNFIALKVEIPVGPIYVQLRFSVGGSLGVSVGIEMCVLSNYVKGIVTPSVELRIKGSVGIRILIFTGGLTLEGLFMQTRFPLTVTFRFSKFPIGIDKQMDLELIPVTLTLRAWLEIDLWLFSRTLFSGVIWRYQAPTIHENIFTIKDDEPDVDPPLIDSPISPGGDVDVGCIVTQVKNRSPLDTAFLLEVSASDPVSDVHMFYSIGTTSGTADVSDWTDYSGPSLVVPTKDDLPNSIPLYWNVKARNSQGLEIYTTCQLSTYDNTIPDGRVDSSFAFSSHPSVLSGTITVFDDSQLKEPHYKAVGFSSGRYGNEVRDWEKMTLNNNSPRSNEPSELKYFSTPKAGKLTVASFASSKTMTALLCAHECLSYDRKCVSFDYAYHTEQCDLHSVVEGHQAKLRIIGTYANYERLNIGSTVYVLYTDLTLVHGLTYFINVHVTNVLEYEGFMKSSGTIVDFTPPETGPLGKGYNETIQADRCHAALTQRCIYVTDLLNHRIIRDGEQGQTIYNGHVPQTDLLYSLANHYLTVNFDGFNDNESGIWGYTWSAGTNVCGSDVVPERDPHGHLSHDKYWTHTGYTKDLSLSDGKYYVMVSAINNVVHGGALVTTVCHTTSIVIDTTPPVFEEVSGVYFDEDFDILAIYYTAFDEGSKLKLIEFGLGKTKHDVTIRGYSEYPLVTGDDPFVGVEDFDLTPGVYAWIRLRVENNVGLFTSGHGEDPIMIDRTAPLVGIVNDGAIIKSDIQYQYDTTTICANWVEFYDPESGISKFKWGVGTTSGQDNIVSFRNLTHHEKHVCSSGVSLHHNKTYFYTVFAYNSALNQKFVNTSSNGVLVDVTPPDVGWVHDGLSGHSDVQFSSLSASKSCTWNNFTDAESNIDHFEASVYVNNELRKTFGVTKNTNIFTDHTVTMEHSDVIYWTLTAHNGAGLQTDAATDGFRVDHSAPVMEYIRDSNTGSEYQSNSSKLDISWKVSDPESGISHHSFYIQELKHGSKSRFWPKEKQYEVVYESTGDMAFPLQDLELKDGAMYSVKVISTNNALLSTHHQSQGVIVDTTAPIITDVHVGVVGEDEDLDENGNIIHVELAPLRVNWAGFDSNSGISHFYLGVGTAVGDSSLTNGLLDMHQKTSIVLENLNLEGFDSSQKKYYVTLWAENGAGLMSDFLSSKSIVVAEANVPGSVNDGFDDSIDSDVETDKRSIGVSFNGFRSAACNIVKYEWAVGSGAYFSDIVPFSDFGIVLRNESFGHAHLNIKLDENVFYYIAVRASTGHDCHEQYIVSTSDGFKIDTTIPTISAISPPENDTDYVHNNQNLFIRNVDSPVLHWEVFDSSHIRSMKWGAGSLPYLDDLHKLSETSQYRLQLGDLSISSGETFWLYVTAEDTAGNIGLSLSPPITSDTTAPLINNLHCDPTTSMKYGIVTCNWDAEEEFESNLIGLEIAIGTSEDLQTILTYTAIHIEKQQWSKDIKTDIASLQVTALYVSFRVSNILNFVQDYVVKLDIDNTPPVIESVVITTSMETGNDVQTSHQQCQIPTSYVEVTLGTLEDAESPIERLEVSLSSDIGEEDILPYTDITTPLEGSIFFGHLSLEPGTQVYAKARVHNVVGLYSTVLSDSVMISQPAKLVIHDGIFGTDRDVQNELNKMDGKWYYSGYCDVQEAEWSILDSTGAILQPFQLLPDTTVMFYNDELQLINGITYMNVIRTTDGLNRTIEHSSDGITVNIQPPSPGFVRDGLEEDINYQLAHEHLSGNWDEFGDKTSTDLTQLISHYEAAISNDVRYESMRANVHPFVNTRLDTFITFSSLNLTKTSVTYFITVRAYSVSGSFEEAYSNGIKVGYQDGIRGGSVTSTMYQHETQRLSFSWSGFESDIGLRRFYVGIVSAGVSVTNESFPQEQLSTFANNFDVFPLTDVNADTFFEALDITLLHGQSYHPVVVAIDNAGACKAVTGESVLVDTTPPLTSEAILLINGRISSTFIYIDSSDTVCVEWKNITDSESDILSFIVTVWEYQGCNGNGDDSQKVLLKSVTVSSETQVNFRDMNLASKQNYVVSIETVNNAGLSGFTNQFYFRIDDSKPLEGTVKIGEDWFQKTTYQSSKKSIRALVAIARSEESFTCPSQIQLLPKKENNAGWFEESTCVDNCVHITNDLLRLKIGYNIAITTIDTGCISSDTITIRKGEYTATLNAAGGSNTISSFFIGTSLKTVSTSLEPPVPNDFFSASNENDNATSDASNTTMSQNGTVGNVDTPEIVRNEEDIGVDGCGVSIIGEKQIDSRYWDGVFWCVDKNGRNKEWFTLKNDPTDRINSLTIRLLGNESGTWDLDLLINGEQKAVLSGTLLPQRARLYFHTATNNGYVYPKNPFDPFRSYVTITDVSIPTEDESMCQYGKGFFDNESDIQSIWLGVSDNLDEADNIEPFKNVQTFCQKCTDNCSVGCDEQCSLNSDFELFSYQISDLNLQETVIDKSEDSVTVKNDTTYYVNAKVINFAGDESMSYSNGIMVDTTPPVCESVKCLDPAYSSTEETSFIGTDRRLGAYWSCGEDISELKEAIVSITSLDDGMIVYQEKSIGMNTSADIELFNGTNFKDKGQYRFNLKIINVAGLSSIYFCDVKVLLTPPAIDKIELSTFFGAVTDNASSVEWIEFNDRLGISWTNEDDDVEFYEWKVGTEPGKDDIIPLSIIGGNKSSSSFYILNNQIWIDGVVAQWSLADLADPSNHSQDNASSTDSMLQLEPGRCMYITLQARGHSHLTSVIHKAPLCIARTADATIKSTTQSQMVVYAFQGSMTTLQDGNEASSDFLVNVTEFFGDAVVGLLSDIDITTTYGSAASATFPSFIANPNITQEMTSRILTNRIIRFLGQTFFMSPTPIYEFTSMKIKIAVNSTFEPNSVPVLAVWISNDDGTGFWDITDQSCTSGYYEVDDDGYLVFEICQTETSRRKRRSTGNTVSTPSQFAVFVMNQTYSNTPPVLNTSLVSMDEDTYLDTVQLLWSDADSDSVTFELSSIHENDSINITSDGKLSFTPLPHYVGAFPVNVILKENTSHAEKLETNGVLSIYVVNVNDPPILLFQQQDGSVSDSRQIHNTTLFLESNLTQYDIGTLVVYDFDENDTFVFLEMTKRNGQVTNETTMSIHETTERSILVDVMDSEYVKQTLYANVNVSSQNNLTGEIHFHFRVHDHDIAYSYEHVAVVFFLFNPCVHGSCGTKVTDGPPCNSTLRSVTFEPYVCVCEKGFEGVWCQDEIDECETIGCSWFHFCTDIIGDVECTLNYSKLIPITIVCSLAVIALGVSIWVFGRQQYRKSVHKDTVDVDSIGSQTNFAFEDSEELRPASTKAAWPPTSTTFRHPTLENKKPIFNHKWNTQRLDQPDEEIPTYGQGYLSGPKDDTKIFRDETNMGSFGSLRSGPFYVKHAWQETTSPFDVPGHGENGNFDGEDLESLPFSTIMTQKQGKPPTSTSYPLFGPQ